MGVVGQLREHILEGILLFYCYTFTQITGNISNASFEKVNFLTCGLII